MLRSLISVAVALLSAGTVYGQVVVEHLYVPMPVDTTVNIGPLTAYTDMPETEKTVTIPAGIAVIEWDLFQTIGGFTEGRVRPVIGNSFPSLGFITTPGSKQGSGSWAIHTDGGTMTVKLQADAWTPDAGSPTNITYRPATSLSWTLTVYPDAEPVPAVSTVGLGLMVVLLLAGGAVVLTRPQRQAA